MKKSTNSTSNEKNGRIATQEELDKAWEKIISIPDFIKIMKRLAKR